MTHKINGFKFFMAGAALVLFGVQSAIAAPDKLKRDDFIISSGEYESGVSAAYYYGDKTVIAFADNPLYFSVVDEAGKRIPFNRDGKYAYLLGKHKSFVASIDGHAVTFNEILTKQESIKSRVNLKGYDFNYRVAGDQDSSPIQIFDDGTKTFIQFRKGQTIPAVFGITKDGAQLLKLKDENDQLHHSFSGVMDSIQFVLGSNSSLAEYTGKRKVVVASTENKFLPSWFNPSPVTPTPVVPVAAAVAPKPAPIAATAASTNPTFAPSLSSVAGNVAPLPGAVAAPVNEVVESVVASIPEPIIPACVWELKANQSYAPQLKKWALCAGWNDIEFVSSKPLAPSYYAEFKGSFIDALFQLRKATGWEIIVHSENKIVRVIAAN